MDTGTLFFITGGTTGAPKLVAYADGRFQDVVQTKRRMLAHCGVDAASRVLVLHPMSPWAIGVVFSEAALGCGAQVLPAGIALQASTLLGLCEAFRPTVVCAGGRNLLRLLKEIPAGSRVGPFEDTRLVLTAGEQLDDRVRSTLQEQLHCDIRDVYGCAELDALAVEQKDGRGHWLVPDLEYMLEVEGRPLALTRGLIGILLGRHHHGGSWHRTGDIVEVLADDDSASPWGTPLIAIRGREGMRVKFGEGSAIGQLQLDQVREKLSLRALQLVVRRSPAADRVEIIYCAAGKAAIPPEAIVNALLAQCTDFADACSAGCIAELRARAVADVTGLLETERQKAPAIVVIEEP